ncbi:hypothetical protein GGI07_003279 [Coemansia sp. Benny D115]|nr:hypothetical protein GGI07_003279 [Coemansia sp. Benny D115]
MFSCKSCDCQYDCMDLYYDHIMFDSRHQETVKREAAAEAGTKRMSSLGNLRKRSLVMFSKNSQIRPQTVSMQSNKATFVIGAEAY